MFRPRFLFASLSAVVLIAAQSGVARGGVITINFDAIDASAAPNGVGGATLANYLAGFGVSFTNTTPGTQMQVYDARLVYPAIQPIHPPSLYNVLFQTGSNNPVTYTVNFDRLLDSFSMTRPFIDSGVTGVALPFWRATALDANGNSLGFVGEAARSIFSDIPAQTFTLQGPGIARVRIDNVNGNFAAFSSMPLDDFVLRFQDTAVPEPMSLAVFGGLAAVGWGVARRRRTA